MAELAGQLQIRRAIAGQCEQRRIARVVMRQAPIGWGNPQRRISIRRAIVDFDTVRDFVRADQLNRCRKLRTEWQIQAGLGEHPSPELRRILAAQRRVI